MMISKRGIAGLLILLLLPVHTVLAATNNTGYVLEEDILQYESIEDPGTEETTTYSAIMPRASSILSATTWTLSKNTCKYSLTFLGRSTGSGQATLQVKSGNSWYTYDDVSISFSNTWSFDSSITVSNLAAGTYRLRFDLDVSRDGKEYSETIYTLSKKIS